MIFPVSENLTDESENESSCRDCIRQCWSKGLKGILHMAVNNAVSRMETLTDPFDRRCIFLEYKEWLGESININDQIWAIPIEAIQNDNG